MTNSVAEKSHCGRSFIFVDLTVQLYPSGKKREGEGDLRLSLHPSKDTSLASQEFWTDPAFGRTIEVLDATDLNEHIITYMYVCNMPYLLTFVVLVEQHSLLALLVLENRLPQRPEGCEMSELLTGGESRVPPSNVASRLETTRFTG